MYKRQIPLSYVNIDLEPDIKNSCVKIKAEASLVGKTGVEMEAFTAVSVASLTIYDMCKSVDREMVISDIKLIEQDILEADFSDASVILCWFMDPDIMENMMKRFEKLRDGVKVITIWAPLPGCLPQKVDFPYIMNETPFVETDDLKKQLLAVFETECIGFVTAWEFAERYTKSIGRDNPQNDRFLVIIQALTIWINAKNLGVACGEEMPESIRSYIAILKEYFDIEIEHLLK